MYVSPAECDPIKTGICWVKLQNAEKLIFGFKGSIYEEGNDPQDWGYDLTVCR